MEDGADTHLCNTYYLQIIFALVLAKKSLAVGVTDVRYEICTLQSALETALHRFCISLSTYIPSSLGV